MMRGRLSRPKKIWMSSVWSECGRSAGPLRESKVCDAIVVNMIDVGEETGDLDVMLLKIADNYDEEVDVAVGGLIKLIEPLLIVVLGGAVGTIVVSMFLPLVAMIESLQQGGAV